MDPELGSVRAVVRTRDGFQVRIQALDSQRGHHELLRYPTAVRPVAWHDQLAHQTRLATTPQECLRVVRAAYGRVLGWA